MFGIFDFFLYLLADEKVQKNIKASKDTPDLLGRIVPLLIRDFFRLDLKKLDHHVRDSRNFRELGIKVLTDITEAGKNGNTVEGGRVIPFSDDVSSKDSRIPVGN